MKWHLTTNINQTTTQKLVGAGRMAKGGSQNIDDLLSRMAPEPVALNLLAAP